MAYQRPSVVLASACKDEEDSKNREAPVVGVDLFVLSKS